MKKDSFHPVECYVGALAQWFSVKYLLTRARVALQATFALARVGWGTVGTPFYLKKNTKRDRKEQKKYSTDLSEYILMYASHFSIWIKLRSQDVLKCKII